MWFWLGIGVVGVAVLAIEALPNVRRGAVMRSAEGLARAAAPAQPGDDWPAIYARLQSRHVGRSVGTITGVVACGALLFGGGSPFVDVPFPVVLLLPSALTTSGALLGHVLAVRGGGRAPRLASMRRRELRDYLTPVELRLVRLSFLVPLLVAALGVVTVWHGKDPRLGWMQVGCGAASLAVGLLVTPLARWSLAAPSDVSTEGGLVWAELLRGVLLRDVVAGLWGSATLLGGLMPVVAWASGEQPAVGDVLGVVVVGLAITVNLGFAVASSRDSNHSWARAHATAGVAS